MATLYEISQEILNCVQVEDGTTVNVETGEVIDLEKLDALKMQKSEKVRNIALFIKNLKADAKAYKEEKEAFCARQKAAENKAAQLENYLSHVLDGEKVKEKEFSISWRKSKAVNILDEKKIPSDYLIQQAPKIDKAGIRAALKDGGEVPGAELKESVNIQIK